MIFHYDADVCNEWMNDMRLQFRSISKYSECFKVFVITHCKTFHNNINTDVMKNKQLKTNDNPHYYVL